MRPSPATAVNQRRPRQGPPRTPSPAPADQQPATGTQARRRLTAALVGLVVLIVIVVAIVLASKSSPSGPHNLRTVNEHNMKETSEALTQLVNENVQ
ncbi:MAG: hypothetical protein WB698_00165, partial [Solirubrobacteraceae bacterium]